VCATAGVGDAAVATAWQHLQRQAWFRHDSFEPVLATLSFWVFIHVFRLLQLASFDAGAAAAAVAAATPAGVEVKISNGVKISKSPSSSSPPSSKPSLSPSARALSSLANWRRGHPLLLSGESLIRYFLFCFLFALHSFVSRSDFLPVLCNDSVFIFHATILVLYSIIQLQFVFTGVAYLLPLLSFDAL
jgi:hypothetical protein